MIEDNELYQTKCSIEFAVEDIYGKGWLARNKAYLDQKYKWSFKNALKGDKICVTSNSGASEMTFDGWFGAKSRYPVIVLEKKVEYEFVTDGVMRKPVEGEYILDGSTMKKYDGYRGPQSQLVFKKVEKEA